MSHSRRNAIVKSTCIVAVAIAMTGQAAAADWYVDGRDGQDPAAGTIDAPFARLWQALHKARPGDTIYVVPSIVYPFLGLSANGSPEAPITLTGADPAHPTKVAGGGHSAGIWINGNYLVVTGFDVTAKGYYPAISVSTDHHNILIAGNTVHDAGGNGINIFGDDYVTVSHNVVYGNARVTTHAFNSGISILASTDIDDNAGTKMLIDGNLIYENTNVPNCRSETCLDSASDSDGNGINIDDNQRRRFDGVAYRGSFLISNNLIWKNGGRGVHVFRSDNVMITGNTMLANNQDAYEGFWHPGEVSALQASNVAVLNNILRSDGRNARNLTGTAPNTHVGVSFEECQPGRGAMTAQANVIYNPQDDATLQFYMRHNEGDVQLEPNLFAGPKLVSPSQLDFRFAATSPAFGAADPATSMAVDILGVSRGDRPSIGAYQEPAP